MARLEPLQSDALAELEPLMAFVEQNMGFRPNSMATMAHLPGLPQAFAQLTGVVWGSTGVDPALKALVAVMASQAAGCRYCQAHTAHRAHEQFGVSAEKLSALWSFEQADCFDAPERAALRVAAGSAQAPSAVDDAAMAELRRHFEDSAVAELVAVIALFGFLNRWNDTLATELEDTPRAFAEEALAPVGWTPGAHEGSS